MYKVKDDAHSPCIDSIPQPSSRKPTALSSCLCHSRHSRN